MYGSTTADPTLNNLSKIFTFSTTTKAPRGDGGHVGNPALPVPPVDARQTLPEPLDHINHPILKGIQTVRNAGPVSRGYLAQP